MSFLSKLAGSASKAWSYFTENSTGKSIANAAILGYTLHKLNNAANKRSDPPITTTTSTSTQTGNGGSQLTMYRVQLDPDTNARIPVVYGEAYVGGKVIDARLGEDVCKTMWFCLALSEQTGNLLDSTASQLTIEECYWNGNKIQFQNDGITAARFINDDGEYDDKIAGKIRVYPFSGDSESPTNIRNYNNGNTANAYNLFPRWTSTNKMSDLVFVLISMDYFPSGDIRGLGTWTFKVKNTMSKPGDVLYDYMTNTRYGAGIPPEEINA
jgi:hypothetical protein